MEANAASGVHDGSESNLGNKEAEYGNPKREAKDVSRTETVQPYAVNQEEAPKHVNQSGEFNMEATITPEDVIRAGGFGARDDLSSFLPVASDSTDFEASLLDARDYEDPQGERCRPGLGWNEATRSE